MKILVINCGSSSVKYKVFQAPSFRLIRGGLIGKIGQSKSAVRNHYHAVLGAFREMVVAGLDISQISAIGHRVVHGGEKFKEPVLIDKRVLRQVRKNIEIAPLHNPVNLEGILACKKILPKTRQVAVFDTAFHQTIPRYAYLYGLPYRFYKKYRIRRYGFHGISHQYVAEAASRILRKSLRRLRLITVHLGNGCSIAAIDRGKSIDTSMGFTPLEGLIMGTRCGDIDPALILYINRKLSLKLDEVDEILNKKSGLLGVSGISNDIRPIKRAIKKKDPRAKLALDMFIYRIKKYIGTYIGILGGVNAVVFTAGIGENNPDIVRRITRDLDTFLKVKPCVLVIPTDEELMIARLTYSKMRCIIQR